jgi:hypothetical protein
MNDAVDVIERVLKTSVLSPGLSVIPEQGASQANCDEEERLLPRPLSPAVRRVLSRWNGLDLDVVRLYGCGSVARGIKRLSAHQLVEADELRDLDEPMVIGSDSSGFVYIEDAQGRVWSLDTDGGELTRLADSLDDFLGRVVFGEGAEAFAGSQWAQTLRRAGLLA